MSIILIDIDCPNCNKTCWFKNYESYDETSCFYVEAISCAYCGHPFWTDEEYRSLYEDYYEEVIDINDMVETSYKTAEEALNN